MIIGTVEWQLDNSKNTTQLEFKIRGVPKKTTFEIFLENPDTVTLEKFASMETSRSSKAKFSLDTSLGEALPFGAPSISDLFNRVLEIRLLDGTPVFSGFIPEPPAGAE